MPVEAAANEPKPVKQAQPIYPRSAARKSLGGCVVVAVEVDAEGVGKRFAILDSQPEGVFDAATLAALHEWRWESGKPGWVPQRIEYRMSPQSTPPPSCMDAERARTFRTQKP